MQRHLLIALALAVALMAGCRTPHPQSAPLPLATGDTDVEGTVVGDDRTAMEAAIDTRVAARAMAGMGAHDAAGAAIRHGGKSSGVALAANAPDSYLVKRGDTLWGIAAVFLRDPWFWPEIWQVNQQIRNPHLIYPGDTLRLVTVDGQPRVTLERGMERGDTVHVVPRVRSEPLESAVTTIPYEAVAAFMSKPAVLSDEQIKTAPYVLASRDRHIVVSSGNTMYARGFASPVEVGAHYNVIRVGDPLRDPDDDRIVGYDGIFTGSGHVTRSGDPATLIMTESSRETVPGDKLFPGGVEETLDFVPAPPKVRVDGRIMAVSDGVTVIGQYQVVVINRGSRDGLVAGNVLAIFQVGEVVSDTVNEGYLGGTSRLGATDVQLPDERTGTFMVFKTFERISYGLIMEAKNIIRVADRVENP